VTPPELTAEQRQLLDRHLDELSTWNRRLNLTTVPRERAWEKHVGESLTLLAAAAAAPGTRWLDLGSGGGVPGMVIAIVRPDLSMTLVEADRRKAGFLVHLAGLLERDNVIVAARRAEEMARDDAHRGGYDVVVSRAAAPPARLVELAMPLLRPGGSLWALVADAEAAATSAAASGWTARAQPGGVLMVERAIEPTAG
jgi:16S rRNA (guanine527-N7)-methyltransferase